MLWSDRPHDLDVPIAYNDRADLLALRDMGLWEVTAPTVDIIAMMPDEEYHYQFIEVTGALRLRPPA